MSIIIVRFSSTRKRVFCTNFNARSIYRSSRIKIHHTGSAVFVSQSLLFFIVMTGCRQSCCLVYNSTVFLHVFDKSFSFFAVLFSLTLNIFYLLIDNFLYFRIFVKELSSMVKSRFNTDQRVAFLIGLVYSTLMFSCGFLSFFSSLFYLFPGFTTFSAISFTIRLKTPNAPLLTKDAMVRKIRPIIVISVIFHPYLQSSVSSGAIHFSSGRKHTSWRFTVSIAGAFSSLFCAFLFCRGYSGLPKIFI